MVTKLLERAIEIEGLLRVVRDGKPLPETFSLLNEKAIELAAGVRRLAGSPQIIDDTPSYNDNEHVLIAKETAIEGPMIIMPADQGEEGINKDEQKNVSPKEILISLDVPKPQQEENHENLSDDEEEEAEETSDIEIGAAENEPATEAMMPALEEKEDEDDDDIVLSLDEEEEEEADDEKTSNKTMEDETIIEIKDDVEPISTPTKDELLIEIKEDVKVETKPTPPEIENRQSINIKENTNFKKKGSLKSAFSLNDRFLYSRELFDGNMKMFDSTLEFLNDINNQSMIEDYFYNEMGWDRENETVVSFIEIIKLRIEN